MTKVYCSNCGEGFFRDLNRVNETKKLGWNSYCSLECQYDYKSTSIDCVCSRRDCKKVFKRQKSEHGELKKHYCSRKCAVIVNNSRYPKRKALVKKCFYCGKGYKGSSTKYCSTACRYKDVQITSKEIIGLLKQFVVENDRIPTKREFPHYRVIRSRFGTWNNAIIAAGFKPNPVMFAKKYEANDGHRCDSLSEKIIDDWFYARKIKHEVNCPYPGNDGFTSDFKVGEYWIEFFGLSGQLKKYDDLKLKKVNLANFHKLKVIEIYQADLFPKSRLDIILGELLG